MFDVAFYMKVNELKKQLARKEIKDQQLVIDRLEEFRNKKPVVYNIETTNACNMKCKMCPRTTMMTRPVETMDIDLFQLDVEANCLETFVKESLATAERATDSCVRRLCSKPQDSEGKTWRSSR